MPTEQRTLTEVDGVVEIGPVGPATQKEVAPAQANTSRKRDAGLEEPNAKGAKGAKEGSDADAEMEVDNLAAGGFFGWMGRDQLGAGRVRAGAYPPPAAQGPCLSRSGREGDGECPGSIHLMLSP